MPKAVEVPSDRRITTLDGLRGLAAIMVVVSHYFAELPGGISALMFGWIGVDIFFVLSGFLIGKLILERQHHSNFFTVFYVRRTFRIIPAYVVTVVALFVLIDRLPPEWADADTSFPLWSYLLFVQNFFMASTGSVGAHWLAPTWTLAVEEHFYLVIPAIIVFTPRRWLTRVLIATAIAAVLFRVAISYSDLSALASLVMLPGRADTLICGLLAAIAFKSGTINWVRLIPALRIFPIAALVAAILTRLISPELFGVLAPLFVGAGCAAYLLCIVLGTPEARRYHSKVLQFFGNNGYCLYLVHLPILGLMHGLILGAKPALVTPTQWMVTFAALPICVLVGWAMTKLIEEPLTHYGRTWRWSPELSAPPLDTKTIPSPNR
ncbi:MAG TPA: acyltransferase [Xanthobacteraceae bacterium]|nr:acyltransferase [Xanthobacteraceae bacterium]